MCQVPLCHLTLPVLTKGTSIRTTSYVYLLLSQISQWQTYAVDRARVNSPTRYSPEAAAEGLYQVGLFTSALSHLYHGYFKISPCLQMSVVCSTHGMLHINSMA